MYKDTVTIFTRAGNVWYPTLVKGADFNGNRAAILARYGENSKDNAELHLRLGKCGCVAGKRYVLPKEWDSLTDKADSFAMRESDFFIVGDYTSLATGGTVSDLTYHDGFYNHMNRTYDNVYLITSVARYSVIPHFEVLAR